MSSPPFIVHSGDVPEEEGSYPAPFDAEKLSLGRNLGEAIGTRSLGVWRERLPPGRRTSFTHAHLREEEIIYVLSGRPSVRWVEPGHAPGEPHAQEKELRPGDVVAFRAGTAVAHTFVNHTDEDTELLVVGERRPSEQVFYPEDPVFNTWRAGQHPLRTWDHPDSRDESSTWPPVRIETERLVLRPWTPADAQSLLAAQIRNQPHLVRWMPWAVKLNTLDELHERILQWQVTKPGQRDVVYGVFSPEGRIIGGTGFHARVGELGLEIGYWVDVASEGKGYVTEWVAALVRLGLEVLRLDRIEIHCEPQNARSAAVPKRLGFTHEGTLPRRVRGSDEQPKDSMIFSLYADAYPDTPAAKAGVKAWDGLGRRLL